MPDPTLTLLFTQRFGALDRILSLLRRRGFPVQGISVERTNHPDLGRMTVVVGNTGALEQVRRHLQKLPDVVEITAMESEHSVQRAYALGRVRSTPQRRPELMALLAAHSARILSTHADHLVLEATGTEEQLDQLFAELEPFGLDEAARTSALAMRRMPAETTS